MGAHPAMVDVHTDQGRIDLREAVHGGSGLDDLELDSLKATIFEPDLVDHHLQRTPPSSIPRRAGSRRRRASALGALAPYKVHGEAAGTIGKRPWGERSFYVVDLWGNDVCFVEDSTLYT